jgi:hypothetical protein
VSSRALVLVGLAVAVLAMGVYLFIQVRATPAEARVAPHAPVHAQVAEHEDVTPSTEPAEPGQPARGGPKMGRPLSADELRPSTPPPPASGDAPALTNDVPDKTDPRFQMVLAEANKAYDRQDFDEARSIATRVLAKDPTNIRMLRIMVSSHCIEGDTNSARTYYDKLPDFDRQQMDKRCATYGVTFK